MPPETTATADVAEIRRALALLHEPGSVAELRVPHTPRRTVSGYFTDRNKLANAAGVWSGKAPGVYVTVNPVKRDLLARSDNRVRVYARATTGDADVVCRRWLPVDFDPVRAGGISSTDTEHKAALARARDFRDWLLTLGFPPAAILLADSGNGAHVLVRIDLRNDVAARTLVQRCLEAAAFAFNDDQVLVDVGVFNAARIWKVYGTLAAKGENLPERPHRFARLLEVPDPPLPASRDMLERLAAMAPAGAANGARARREHGTDFDLERWIGEHNLPVARSGAWNGGRRWVLNPCPWNTEHTNGAAYIVRFPSGAIAAGCHHNGCQGNDWRTLRDLVEPDWRARYRGDAHAQARRDAHHDRHDHEERQAEGENGGADDRPGERFRLVSVDEVLQRPPVECLVEGVMERGTVNVMHGDSGTYKSTLALDLALSVATGTLWHGRAVKPGLVVYICAEGQAGMSKRLRAWIRERGVSENINLKFIEEAVDPLSRDDVDVLCARLRTLPTPPMLVVVDTWSACLAVGAADEDKNRDAAQGIAAFKRIAAAFGATLLIVHHEGHGARGRARGASALRNNADGTFAVSLRNTTTVTIKNPKQKDLATFDPIILQRVVISLEEGVTSVVLISAHEEARPSKAVAGTLAALRHFGAAGASYSDWRRESAKAETTFRRHMDSLCEHGYVELDHGLYGLTPKGRSYRRSGGGGSPPPSDPGGQGNRHDTAAEEERDSSTTGAGSSTNRHNRHKTATAQNGGGQSNRHHQPPPYGGGGEGGDGGGGSGCDDFEEGFA